MTPPPQLLDVEQVARHLGVCTKTVRRLYKTGKIPASRVGRLIRIPETAVSAYLNESRVKVVS